MPLIDYPFQVPYRYVPGHRESFPALELRLATDTTEADIQGIIDTGAMRTLISGNTAMILGIEIAKGKPVPMATLTSWISAWSHKLNVRIFDVSFEIELCFAETQLNRNIIGRDILDKLQIGIREHHSLLYVSTDQ